MNSTWAVADGPVFLLLGGEGPATSVWLEQSTAIMDYARTHGARGDSHPTKDVSDLSLLSSEQVNVYPM